MFDMIVGRPDECVSGSQGLRLDLKTPPDITKQHVMTDFSFAMSH